MKTQNRSAMLIMGLLLAVALVGSIIYAGFAMQPAPSNKDEIMFVAPELADCTGVGPMRCLQIAERAEGPWSFWYSGIEGFEHQPGFLYELSVRREVIANPPADGASLRLILVKQLSKTPAAPSAANGLKDTRWNLVSIDGTPAVAGAQPATIEFAGNQVSGSTGCNGMFGDYTVRGEVLSFGALSGTKMACSPELNTQENRFLAALAAAERYTIREATLTITFEGGKEIVFVQA